jgi:hypothetical protein
MHHWVSRHMTSAKANTFLIFLHFFVDQELVLESQKLTRIYTTTTTAMTILETHHPS